MIKNDDMKTHIATKSLYIALEGVIGSGKSTQVKLLANYFKEHYPKKRVIITKEPGGSEIANEIRRTVQGIHIKERMEPICETYLYAASRAQTLRSVVKPTLDKGGVVIADRSFCSSLANQAFGRKLGIKAVWEINKPAIGDIMPDLIFFIDTDITTGIQRSFDKEGDKFESLGKAFHTKILRGYYELAKLPFLKKRFVTVDGNRSIDEVHAEIVTQINKRLKLKS